MRKQPVSIIFLRNDESFLRIKSFIEKPMLLVKPSQHYRQLADNVFQLNPESIEDLQMLFRDLLSQNISIEQVLHLWSFDCNLYDYTGRNRLDSSLYNFMKASAFGVEAVLLLKQAAKFFEIHFPIHFFHYGRKRQSQLHNQLLSQCQPTAEDNATIIEHCLAQPEEVLGLISLILNQKNGQGSLKGQGSLQEIWQKTLIDKPYQITLQKDAGYLIVGNDEEQMSSLLKSIIATEDCSILFATPPGCLINFSKFGRETICLDTQGRDPEEILIPLYEAQLQALRSKLARCKGVFICEPRSDAKQSGTKTDLGFSFLVYMVEQCTQDLPLDFFQWLVPNQSCSRFASFAMALIEQRTALQEASHRQGSSHIALQNALVFIKQEKTVKNVGTASLSEQLRANIFQMIADIADCPLSTISDSLRIDLDGRDGIKFDSMKIIELVNRMNAKFGIKLTPVVFFQYPELSLFLGFLEKKYRQSLESYFLGETV